MVLYLTGLCFAGCAARYGRYDPERKEALRTFAAGLLGALAMGNTGGAIVGAFVADIYNISYVKYEDKKLEDTDEASRKSNDRLREAEQKREEQKAEDLHDENKKAEKERPVDQKAEKERPVDQKAEKERPVDQKAEKERPVDQKAEKERPVDQKAEKERPVDQKAEKERPVDQKAEKERPVDQKAEKERPVDQKAEKERPVDQKAEKERPVDQKAEKERPVDQKAEKERPVDRAKFSIEEFMVSAQTVRSGSAMQAKVQYTVRTPKDEQKIRLTETRIFFSADKRIELDKREIYRTEGRYVSIIKFNLPEDLPKGYCILYTILSDGKRSKTERTVINII